jgi:hypothetical protein
MLDTELARKKTEQTVTMPAGDGLNLLSPSVTELTEHQQTLTKKVIMRAIVRQGYGGIEELVQ